VVLQHFSSFILRCSSSLARRKEGVVPMIGLKKKEENALSSHLCGLFTAI